MKTAGGHHTTTSTVRQFAECLAAYFNGWEELSRDMSWEMIYVQQADSTPLDGWRRCDVVNSNNMSEEEDQKNCGVPEGGGAPVPGVCIMQRLLKRRSTPK
ncbi:retrotransposon hot spot (RHS) protein [Trypanosoma cruzi]|nr:retrotransposon hot spot (RHS) protein [Trypanosoma cruzi]